MGLKIWIGDPLILWNNEMTMERDNLNKRNRCTRNNQLDNQIVLAQIGRMGATAILGSALILSGCGGSSGSPAFEVKGINVDLGEKNFVQMAESYGASCETREQSGGAEMMCSLSGEKLTVSGMPVAALAAKLSKDEASGDTDRAISQIALMMARGNGTQKTIEALGIAFKEKYGEPDKSNQHTGELSWEKGAYSLEISREGKVRLYLKANRQAIASDV